MWSVSERFLAAIRGPHRARTTIDAYYGGAPVQTDLPFVDGSVTCDRTSNVRRNASLTFAGDLYPTSPGDPLSCYGSQLRIRRSLVFTDHSEEQVSLGWFRIDSASRSQDGTVSVEASDRSAIVADAKFLTPYSVSTTATVIATITALLAAAVPGSTLTSTATRTLDRPGPATYEDDRLQAVSDLAASIGAEVYANADGNFTLADIPNLATTAPVWDADIGPGGVRISMTRNQSRENVFNGVVIRSDDTSGESGVWQYVATDDDANSPTWWDGPFGQVPTFYSSPTISSVDQAAAAAKGILRESLGISRSVDLSLVPNFALQPGDVINVTDDTGAVESHLIDALSIPLTSAGDMTATTRARTYWLTS